MHMTWCFEHHTAIIMFLIRQVTETWVPYYMQRNYPDIPVYRNNPTGVFSVSKIELLRYNLDIVYNSLSMKTKCTEIYGQ